MIDEEVAFRAIALIVIGPVIAFGVTIILTSLAEKLFLRRGASPAPFLTRETNAYLSLSDLQLLAYSTADRVKAIDAYFEWKHKTLSMLVRAGVAFLLTNLGVLLKLAIGEKPETQSLPLDHPGVLVVITLGLVTVATGILLNRLRRLPLEYVAATKIFTWLRG